MLLIVISYWVGVFLMAAGIAWSTPIANLWVGMVVIGLGAVSQSIALLLRKL